MPSISKLVGKVVKTIIVQPYSAMNFVEAVRLCGFDNAKSLGNIIRLFGEELVGLDKPTKIDLVEFDREWQKDEAIAWGVANGNKRPICTAHLLGIAIQHPDEQRDRPIVELGSVRDGGVLGLHGDSDWRDLSRGMVEGDFGRRCLVGFVSEAA